jgi:hypothetical protein
MVLVIMNPRISPDTPTITNINISIFQKDLRKETDVKKIYPHYSKEFNKPQYTRLGLPDFLNVHCP